MVYPSAATDQPHEGSAQLTNDQKRADSASSLSPKSPALATDSARNAASPSRPSSPTKGQTVHTGHALPPATPAPGRQPASGGVWCREDPWSVLAHGVWKRTHENIERWSNEIASLLTFAGLLSAVITGFGTLAYTTLAAASDPSDAPALHRYVAALWFAALVCSLAAAAVGISLNQWLYYLFTPAGLVASGAQQKLRVWSLRQRTFRRWDVERMLSIPSVLLQVAVTLFLVALVGLLWSLSLDIVIPTLLLVCFVTLFQLTTLIIAAVASYSPFQSPQAQWARWIWLKLLYMFALAAHAFASKLFAPQARKKPVVPPLTARNAGHHSLHIARKLHQPPPRISMLARYCPRPKVPHWINMENLEQHMYYLDHLNRQFDWAKNESFYLESPTSDNDLFLFAAVFSLMQDDIRTLGYIRQCLCDLPAGLACMNASALLDDKLFRTGIQNELSTWRYDIFDNYVAAMMANIIVDVTERLINWEHNDDTGHISPDKVVQDELMKMINRLDELLYFLPQEANEVYHRLLYCLHDREAVSEIEMLARKQILSGIWKHGVASFTIEDAEHIIKVLEKEEEYGMKLKLIILALHILESQHGPMDNILDLLNGFLKSSTSGQFCDAMLSEGPHVFVLLCDLEADAQAAHHENSLARLHEVLRRLLWLAGDVGFRSYDPSTKKMKETSLSDLLQRLHMRLLDASMEPISCSDPPAQQPATELVGQQTEMTLSGGRSEKVDDQRRRFLPHFGCMRPTHVASDLSTLEEGR